MRRLHEEKGNISKEVKVRGIDRPQIGITDGIVNVFREYFNYVAMYLFVIQR